VKAAVRGFTSVYRQQGVRMSQSSRTARQGAGDAMGWWRSFLAGGICFRIQHLTGKAIHHTDIQMTTFLLKK